MNQYEQPALSEGQQHLEAVLANIESVSDIDISFLLTVMPYSEFTHALRAITEAYQARTGKPLETELIFSIADPNIEKYWRDEQGFLRFLKALNEGRYGKHFKKIVVKGPVGTVDIEPNVFASGIKFQLME